MGKKHCFSYFGRGFTCCFVFYVPFKLQFQFIAFDLIALKVHNLLTVALFGGLRKHVVNIYRNSNDFYEDIINLLLPQNTLQNLMSQSNPRSTEYDLLGSLIDEIQNLRPSQVEQSVRDQAMSAPPKFVVASSKIDYDILECSTFEEPDLDDDSIMEAFSDKGKNLFSNDLELAPSSVYRKMSDTTHLHNSNSQTYYQFYSPNEELFSNLEVASDWARDQNGSRTVQEIFETQNNEKKDAIFWAIYKDSIDLMTDRFGNYVLQKVFQKGLAKHKEMLIETIWGSINILSMHAYGCRVIQKMVENIQGIRCKEFLFIKQIEGNVLTLVQNQNANHVIQKCFETMPYEIVFPLTKVLFNNLNYLAYHPFGCRVIQKYLQNYSTQRDCQEMLKLLLKQSIKLSQCQFGNYVMQYVVVRCQSQRKSVFKQFLLHVVELCTNKYASNVIEKSIQVQNSDFSINLTNWFIQNPKEFVLLSKHQFGNYVIQSITKNATKDKFFAFKNILKDHIAEISKSQHGRHVLSQLQLIKMK